MFKNIIVLSLCVAVCGCHMTPQERAAYMHQLNQTANTLAANSAPVPAMSIQNQCRYNPASGTYHQCHHVAADGSCAHYSIGC